MTYLTRVLAIMLGGVLLMSCGPTAAEGGRITVKSAREKPDAASFLRMIGLPVPPAIVEFYRYAPGMDDSARVILVMSQSDWDRMQRTPPLNTIPSGRWNSFDAMLLPDNEGNWRPRNDKAITATQTHLANREALNIGYSPAGPGRVRVYLFWFET